MKKKISFYVVLLLLYVFDVAAQQTMREISGKVISADGRIALNGATIRVKNTNQTTLTDSSGNFRLKTGTKSLILQVSYIGYQKADVFVVADSKSLTILLDVLPAQLAEVVVSTGYQTIPAERATGSFVQVDNKLLNRRVSTNLLERLEDVTPGLLFNKGKSAGANLISIRGQNTIYGNAGPLIVLDNFPYDGDISSINPNDVESISILKDAAAASIWGSRAGNGVIVITTKKGRYNERIKISFNANTTIGEKPDLFYQPRMSSADFIEVEKQLFDKGFYVNAETGYNNPAITPVVELLIAQRDGQVSAEQANLQIANLANNDVRNDFSNYFYQKSINQQYALNLNGGNDIQRYYISGGYDHNRDNLVANGITRYTFNAGQSLSLLNKKLELNTGFYYTKSNLATGNPGTNLIGLRTGSAATLYPYASIADEAGNPLAITHDYRQSFIQDAQQLGLLNWSYKPLEEIILADKTQNSLDYRLNIGLNYKIRPYLTAAILYQYGQTITNGWNLQSLNTYYTRDLINNFTAIDSDGKLTYGIPRGAILDLDNLSAISQSLRGQLNFDRNWLDKHSLTAIAGYEIRDFHTVANSNRSYGYDDSHATSLPVDYITLFPQYAIPGYSTGIPYNNSLADLTDRNISYYANAAYTYLQKYTLSASARLDRSNIFGVKTNQQGVPLYSVGAAWNIDREDFYKIKWLPYLKLRATYGYNGNVNKRLSAYTTALYLTGNSINTIYAQIVNPPNPELRWERVRIINVGLDFASTNNVISGTIESYFKRGIDLIGDIPYAPSTGITTFRGNTANTRGKGVDITLNTQNLRGELKWQTNFFFSHVTDKVVDYALKQSANFYTDFSDNEINPLQGKPFYALYSYQWAGLDPQTGDPQGYLDGKISKDYAQILASATADNIIYHGPARPTSYGAVRNTFTFKQFSISANISYRFGYYFRQPGIFYSNVLSGMGYYEGRYSERWQKTGDEMKTTVPSMPGYIDYDRDSFYSFSSATVQKADNIRLQDINLSYEFNKNASPRLPFSRLQVYVYANNVAMLWKATKTHYDPDFPAADYLSVKTIAAGIKADF